MRASATQRPYRSGVHPRSITSARGRAPPHRVWGSKEDWERFREERAEPALARVFDAAGFARRPPRSEEKELDVADLWLGD